ncbi:hypothetical protein THOM_0996, partial [Trachipleistophora hominis]
VNVTIKFVCSVDVRLVMDVVIQCLCTQASDVSR